MTLLTSVKTEAPCEGQAAVTTPATTKSAPAICRQKRSSFILLEIMRQMRNAKPAGQHVYIYSVKITDAAHVRNIMLNFRKDDFSIPSSDRLHLSHFMAVT